MAGFSEAQVEQYQVEGYVVVPVFFGAEVLAGATAAIEELAQRALGGGDCRLPISDCRFEEGKAGVVPGAGEERSGRDADSTTGVPGTGEGDCRLPIADGRLEDGKVEKLPGVEDVLELEPEAVEGRRVARRIYNPHKAHRAFHDMATTPALLDHVEALLGPDFALHHSKLNMKPARVGSVVEWHQDLAYFPHTNDSLCTVLVYLDQADDHNGCLQVIPRQHHRYFNHLLPNGMFSGMVLEELADGRYGQPVALAGPAGSVIFMHCLTPHSSLPNRSERGRRTLIFEYRAADAFPLYTGDLVVKQEALTEQVRGRATRQARLGGPAPIVPNFQTPYKSLYDSQEKAREAMRKGKR